MATPLKALPGLTVDQSLPAVSQAVSLALALMTAAGSKTWAELVADNESGLSLRQKVAAKVQITQNQATLLNDWDTELTWLSKGTPSITLAVCDVCNEVLVVTSSAPTSCRVTPGCEGAPKRVSAARRSKV